MITLISLLTIGLTLAEEPPESNLFLFLFLVMGVTFVLAVTGIGIVLGLLMAAGVVSLSLFGVTLNAVLAGLLTRQPETGLTALMVQLGGLAGLYVGIGLFFVWRWLLGAGVLGVAEFLATVIAGGTLGCLTTWLCWRLLAGLAASLKGGTSSAWRLLREQHAEA
jgi:hypothetical protein